MLPIENKILNNINGIAFHYYSPVGFGKDVMANFFLSVGLSVQTGASALLESSLLILRMPQVDRSVLIRLNGTIFIKRIY